jgi:hypothetical protein
VHAEERQKGLCHRDQTHNVGLELRPHVVQGLERERPSYGRASVVYEARQPTLPDGLPHLLRGPEHGLPVGHVEGQGHEPFPELLP